MIQEKASAVAPPAVLEFLLVSNNYKTLSVVKGGFEELGAHFGFVPTSELAHDYIGRHKIDGIFVDFEVPGALDLIHSIRLGSSNRYAVIFACVRSATESTAMCAAGANFFLQKPLTVESVVSSITRAQDMMAREQRRFFRHPVSLPVLLTVNGTQQRTMMINLSEGGMAVRGAKQVACPSAVEFYFELSFGQTIRGKGRVTWANEEGMAGIEFLSIRDKGRDHLTTWLSAWQSIPSKPSVADA